MRNPAFRKLPLDSFIASSSRLTKSKLQIEAMIKYTPESNPDGFLLPQALKLCQSVLYSIDRAIGEATSRNHIKQLKDDIGEVATLYEKKLIDVHNVERECLRQGKVVIKKGQAESTYQIMLLDNILILYRKKSDSTKLKAVIFSSSYLSWFRWYS